MADMLVKLYALPELAAALQALRAPNVLLRRAHCTEKPFIREWVRHHFGASSAAHVEAAMAWRPVACHIAVQTVGPDDPNEADDANHTGPARGSPYQVAPEILLGFACYDVTALGMFGPMGVRADRRGEGIGQVLLLASLHAMAAAGYAYAVIGWAGPAGFYANVAGATVIEGSEPGVYRGPLVDDAPDAD